MTKAAAKTKEMLEAELEFKQAMTFFRTNYLSKALDKLRRAVELDKQNALYVSYLGLLVALAQKNYPVAEELCHRAVRMNRKEVQGYLNLAEVYIQAGQKSDAVEALTVGLPYTKRDVRLIRALRKLGVRRPPVLSWLERQHFLNRHLGKLRHKFLQMLGHE